MAGMLPGVECARRRRLHQSGGCSDSPASTRRSSFCLYTTSHVHDHSLSSSSSSSSLLQQRSSQHQACPDEMLGGAAREAKERLDERLRAQRNSQSKREGRKEKEKEERREAELQIEVYGSKRSGCRRLMGWSRLKLKWKGSDSEEEECAVCLESFEAGDTLIHLPCAHRFHSTCLDPWLQHSAHCPCCRMAIISH